jgi:hypothetical protein
MKCINIFHYSTGRIPLPSHVYYAVPHNNRYTLFLENIGIYFALQQALFRRSFPPLFFFILRYDCTCLISYITSERWPLHYSVFTDCTHSKQQVVVSWVMSWLGFHKKSLLRTPALFESEARRNDIKEFSPYLKENRTLHHYKDQLVNAV